MNKKNILIFFILSLIIGIIFGYIIDILIKKDKMYIYTKNYIQNNSIIKSEFGEIKDRSIKLLKFSKNYIGPTGEAFLKIKIKGMKKKGEIIIEYKKEKWEWYLTKVDLIIQNKPPIKIIEKFEKTSNLD